jgi:hypothetical protein
VEPARASAALRSIAAPQRCAPEIDFERPRAHIISIMFMSARTYRSLLFAGSLLAGI